MSPALINGEAGHTNGHANGVKKPHQDGFGTRAIHVGSEPNAETGAVIPPISLSTTYKQDGIGNHKVSHGVLKFKRASFLLGNMAAWFS